MNRSALMALLSILLFAHSGKSETASAPGSKPKSKAGETKSDAVDLVRRETLQREYMVKVARQLGVTCNYCHDVKNFRSTALPAYKVAVEHTKIVDLLNTKGFLGPKAPRADCYMCHRGKAIPDYKEPR
jgi:hypothetical protein